MWNWSENYDRWGENALKIGKKKWNRLKNWDEILNWSENWDGGGKNYGGKRGENDKKNGVEKMKMTRMELQGKDHSKLGTNRVKIISKKRWNRWNDQVKVTKKMN